jgi:hypothetical protein
MADDFNMDAFMKAANAINPPSPPGKAATNDFDMDAFSRAINSPDDPWTALGASPATQSVHQKRLPFSQSDLNDGSADRSQPPIRRQTLPFSQSDLNDGSADPWAQLGAPPIAKPVGDANYGDIVMRGVAQGIPFANDIAAALDTGAGYLGMPGAPDQSGEPFGKRYSENLARERATLAQEESEHPYLSYGSQIAGAGALPVGGAEAIAGRLANYVGRPLANVAGASALGAGYGAAYGAGSGNDISDRVGRAETGALVGGVGGAALTSLAGAGRNIFGRVAPLVTGSVAPESAATSKIAATMSGDKSGLTPADVAAAQAAGQPVVVGDIGGEATRRLARSAANASPEAAEALRLPLADRMQNQASRFTDFMSSLFGAPLDNQAAVDAIRSQGSAVNTPAYRKAFADGANGVWNGDLANIVQTPAMKSAIDSANIKGATDAVINKQPIVRSPFTTDANGNIALATNPDGSQAIPTLQYWDQVKRALDDKVSSAYTAGNRDDARQLVQLRDYLKSTLDAEVPSYATARAGAFRSLGEENAVTAGQKFLGQSGNMDVNSVLKMLNDPNLLPAQKEAFAQGLAGQMVQKVQSTANNRDISNLFNSDAARQKMQAALGPDRSNQIEAWLMRENVMNRLRQKVMGNSTTAEQLSDLGHTAGGLFAKILANPGAGAIEGGAAAGWESGWDPGTMAKGAAVGALAGAGGAAYRKINQNVLDAVARKLASSDPQDIQQAIGFVAKTPRLMNAMRRFEAGLPAVAGEQAGNQQDQLPQYAQGGSVERPTHEFLVQRLMKLAERAKRDEKRATAPILKLPDSAVTYALALANRYI